MPSIWENTAAYLLSKHYVTWSFRQYFNRVIIKGEKHLPKKGPVILAPNHLNALMDALAVLSLPPFRLPKLFLARADLFKLAPVIVKFLRFAKIMPAFRIRDGYDQLDRNKDTFDGAEQALLNKAALCIMPEGNQGEERNIRPLVKGIFRIAFGTQQKMPPGKSVKIVPIGMEYSNIFEYQPTLIINIGHAIDVADYMPLHAENPVKAINELKSTLRNALESLSVHLPTGENYPIFDNITELVCRDLSKKKKKETPWHLFKARQEVAERLQAISVNQSEKWEALKQLYFDYQQLADELSFPKRIASRPWQPNLKTWQILFRIVVQALLMIPGAVLNYIPYKLIVSVPRIAGIEYNGFFSSVYYGAGIVVLPFYYILVAALVVAFTPLSALSMLVTIPLMYLSGKLSFRLFQNIRYLLSDLKVIKIRKDNPHQFDTLVTIRQTLIKLVD